MAITALHTAATGMQALSTKIDVIANNIANAETVGFKSSRVNFQDLLYQVTSQPGVQTSDDTASPLGTMLGLGVAVSNTQILFRQGAPMQTNRSLDAMINGEGLFQADLGAGRIGYTRAGNFVRNADGDLVFADNVGYRLEPAINVPPEIPESNISIGSNGIVSYLDAAGAIQEAGQIELVKFANPGGLIQFGTNKFLQSDASGDPEAGNPGEEGFGSLMGGVLELSTTEAVTELVELIKTQRVFQMNSQSIQTADEALQVVANLRR